MEAKQKLAKLYQEIDVSSQDSILNAIMNAYNLGFANGKQEFAKDVQVILHPIIEDLKKELVIK